MKVQLFALVVLAASAACGQDCKPDDSASFARVKDAVRTITKEHGYTGWDEKALNRAGDLAAIAIIKTMPDNEINSPETEKYVLLVLHFAFECPSRCVATPSDREPRVTALLLEHLHNNGNEATQSEIEKTKKFIVERTGAADAEGIR
jgi:hypothetical protein